MRTIKICYVDFWASCDYENHILTRALLENYDVQIVNDDSEDYVFFNTLYEEFKKPAVSQHYVSIVEKINKDFNFAYMKFG